MRQPNPTKKVLLCLCLAIAACTSTGEDLEQRADNKTWVFATWNVEHLAYPPTRGCKPRSAQELADLRSYSQSLQADVIALQEVASLKALEQLFPADSWQLFITERPDSEPYECRETGFISTQQKVAYAVRKNIEVTRVTTLPGLGLGLPGLRHGLELAVASPWGEISLLNLHMKSGCFIDNYSRGDSEACKIFAQQAPALDNWIERRERQGTPYIVMGDFNHRLSAPYNHLTRQLTTNSNGSDSTLVNTTAQLIGCHPYYPAPIDHIFAGHLPATVFSKSADVVMFDDMTVNGMLSDHCAMTLTLSAPSRQH